MSEKFDLDVQAETFGEDIPKPWERQVGESILQYQKFCIFRDLGPARTVTGILSKTNHTTLRSLQDVSVRFKWRHRAAAWDEHLNTIKIKAQINEIVEMSKRHAANSFAVETALMEPVRAFLRKIQNGEAARYFDSKPAGVLLNFIIKASDKLPKIIDTERKSRGEPTEITRSEELVENKSVIVHVVLPSEG
jgi:hypothetical protein